jgi:hypothetical protein
MTEAYKCDKCGSYVDDAEKLGYRGNAHIGQAERYLHLCNVCDEGFRMWLSGDYE